MKKIITFIILIIVLIGLVFVGLYFWWFRKAPVPDISDEEKQKAKSQLEILATDLEVPWEIDFLVDGSFIFTERKGTISILRGNEKIESGEIAVAQEGEGGLLGLAINENFVYIYYTYEQNGLKNRVSRFELKDDRITNEKFILDNIPANSNHNGGRIKFGSDNKLYITTGDSENPSLAQDINSLAGKILRLNKDGSFPQDNPFGNAIWSYGHRNPQGLAWQPQTGKLYATEHGPSMMDEINIIEKGKNYGWPIFECDKFQEGEKIEYSKPIACYDQFTLAPSGTTFINPNTLAIASLRGQQLHLVTFENDFISIKKQEQLYSEYGRIRTVVKRGDWIFFATNNQDGRGIPKKDDDKIIRFKF